jgi:hypothetical protein
MFELFESGIKSQSRDKGLGISGEISFLNARNLGNLDWVYLLGRGLRVFRHPAVYAVFMPHGLTYE